jgi:hypothetical protein
MSGSSIKALQSARERPRKKSLSTEIQKVSSKNPRESQEGKSRSESKRIILTAGEFLESIFHNLVVGCVSRPQQLRPGNNRSSVEIIRIHTGFQTLLAQPNARNQLNAFSTNIKGQGPTPNYSPL